MDDMNADLALLNDMERAEEYHTLDAQAYGEYQ